MPLESISPNGILIADQSAHSAELVMQMLRAIGRRDIRQALDAETAMAELDRRPFEALLIDDALRDMDGVQFVFQLRRAEACRNRHIPIIMMAAAPDLARITAARDAGVNEFLRRPFAANHLQSRLKSIHEAPRPIVATESYVGPDRRRKRLEVSEDRRGGPEGSDA
jgi:two-component system chemotaxis response regulator CheY